MPLCSLLQRRFFSVAARIQPFHRSFHNLNAFSALDPDNSISAPSQQENTQVSPFNPNHNQFSPDPLSSSSFNFTPLSRSQGFLSAEEAAAERRRRKRRLRIEPPIQIGQRPPPPPRDPRQPDSTSALTGPRLNLHNRVQSLVRAFDLEAASKLARSAVHGRIRPTVFTCNAIIAAMHRAKRYEESKSLFSYFFEQNTIVPNVVSYNYLINSLCDEGNVDEALSVYRRIIAEAPFGPSHVTYRHLTKGLVDVQRIEEAVELLREMLNKGHGADSLVYNNLIKGYLDLGNLTRADEFFNELKERCLVYDGVVNATYMEFWFEQGKDKEAMESYKSLLDKKYRMVPATCNVLLSVLLKYGKKEQAWALFEHMLDDHTPPTFQAVNSETFNIMVNECFKEGNVEKAVETFRMSGKKVRSKPFAMEVATYNNMMARFCEIDKPKEAETYFDELCSKSLNPDVLSFRTLIDAYLKLEQVDEAVKYLTRMVDSGLRVVASYGVGVFEKLLARGKFDEVFRILSKMGEKEPKPDFPVYEVVVKGFCDACELEKTEEILKQMMTYGVVVSSSLKEAVRNVFQREGKGKEIEDILDEKKWRNSQSYSQTGRQSSASFPPNRSQTTTMNHVSNFLSRNDSSSSSFSAQNVQSSNEQLPWTAKSQPSCNKNVAAFSQSNGQSSPQQNLGEIVKQIGVHSQPLNPTNFQGVKNGDQGPWENNSTNFYGSKSFESHRQQTPSWNNGGHQHQLPSIQSFWNNQRGKGTEKFSGEETAANYNGANHQPSNPQSPWNFQGGPSNTNFPVEDNQVNYNRVHQQPSNPQGSWNLQGGKDTIKLPQEANSWNFNVAPQQPLNNQNSWNFQGGSTPGKWPGEENSLNYYGIHHQPMGAHNQPSNQPNSRPFEGEGPFRWSENQNSPDYYQTTKPVGSHHQPSNLNPNSYNFRESNSTGAHPQQNSRSFQVETPHQWPEKETSQPTKPVGSSHQVSNPSQSSLNFHEPKKFTAHHQPSNQQNTQSFQGEIPYKWPEKESSQPTKPIGSNHQRSNPSQSSLNFNEPKPFTAHHQPSNQRSFQGEISYKWPEKESSQPTKPVVSSHHLSNPSQSSLNFHEPKPFTAHHQPSNQQNSRSFQAEIPYQWPEKEYSPNLSQTTQPAGSWSNTGNFSGQEDPLKRSQQFTTHQNSWGFNDTKSSGKWSEDVQSSKDSGIPNRHSNQQSSLSYNDTNRPTDAHRQYKDQYTKFWKEETKLQTDKPSWQSQAKESQSMSQNQTREQWAPPQPPSTQYPSPKSGQNMENRFQFHKKRQNTSETGDWFAEGLFKTLRESGDT